MLLAHGPIPLCFGGLIKGAATADARGTGFKTPENTPRYTKAQRCWIVSMGICLCINAKRQKDARLESIPQIYRITAKSGIQKTYHPLSRGDCWYWPGYYGHGIIQKIHCVAVAFNLHASSAFVKARPWLVSTNPWVEGGATGGWALLNSFPSVGSASTACPTVEMIQRGLRYIGAGVFYWIIQRRGNIGL